MGRDFFRGEKLHQLSVVWLVVDHGGLLQHGQEVGDVRTLDPCAATSSPRRRTGRVHPVPREDCVHRGSGRDWSWSWTRALVSANPWGETVKNGSSAGGASPVASAVRARAFSTITKHPPSRKNLMATLAQLCLPFGQYGSRHLFRPERCRKR